MLTTLLLILAGLALLRGFLNKIPGVGAALEKFSIQLSAFDVVIGVVALGLGLLELLSLEGILLVLAGLVLAATALASIPSVGGPLARLGRALAEFRVILGAVVLIVGVIDLLRIIFSLRI